MAQPHDRIYTNSRDVTRPHQSLPAEWVISDTHFLCPGAPDESDREVIRSWARLVRAESGVLHLGDLANTAAGLAPLIADLPGRKWLVPGNWDTPETLAVARAAGWVIGAPAPVAYRGWTIHFSQEPIDEDLGPRELNVHGHIHTWPERSPCHLNLSMQMLGPAPRPLAEVIDARLLALGGL